MQNDAKKSPAVIYPSFWMLILACFAGIGLHGFKAAIHSPKIEETGPNCSANSLLKESLEVSGASEKIAAELGKLPSDRRPVVVFWPNINGNAIISYQLASYLSWPREAWSVPMDGQRIGKAVGDFKKAGFGAMIFYMLEPPEPEPDATKIGLMTIVPLEKK